MAKEYAPFVRKIEVEVETLDMVKEAVEAGADIIMLDNMSHEQMKEAMEYIDGRAEVEVSGNVTKREHFTPDRSWCGLYFQRSIDAFCTDSGYFTEKIFTQSKRREGQE